MSDPRVISTFPLISRCYQHATLNTGRPSWGHTNIQSVNGILLLKLHTLCFRAPILVTPPPGIDHRHVHPGRNVPFSNNILHDATPDHVPASIKYLYIITRQVLWSTPSSTVSADTLKCHFHVWGRHRAPQYPWNALRIPSSARYPQHLGKLRLPCCHYILFGTLYKVLQTKPSRTASWCAPQLPTTAKNRAFIFDWYSVNQQPRPPLTPLRHCMVRKHIWGHISHCDYLKTWMNHIQRTFTPNQHCWLWQRSDNYA